MLLDYNALPLKFLAVGWVGVMATQNETDGRGGSQLL